MAYQHGWEGGGDQKELQEKALWTCFCWQVAQEEQERIEREKARIQKQELPLPLQQELMLRVPTLKICIFLYRFEWRECYNFFSCSMLANYVPVSMDIVHSSLHISEELQKEELKARAESQARKDGRNGSCRMEFPAVLNVWKAKILRVGELAAAAEAREREASILHPSGFVVPCVAFHIAWCTNLIGPGRHGAGETGAGRAGGDLFWNSL